MKKEYAKLFQRIVYTIQELRDRAKHALGMEKSPSIGYEWGSDPNKLQGRDRPGYAKWKLQYLGWKDFQAAAIVGNLMQESFSSLRTDIWGDAGTAYGIAQWRHGRLEKLKMFAANRNKPLDDLETQVEYVDWELRNSEKDTGNRLANTTNIDEALEVAIAYERPRGYTRDNPKNGSGYNSRAAYAKSLMV